MKCLIQEPKLDEFEQIRNAVEASKKTCAKNKSTVNNRSKTRWLKKFHSACKNLDDQARPETCKGLDYEAVFQAFEVNTESDSRWVSGGVRHEEMTNCAPYYQNIAKVKKD